MPKVKLNNSTKIVLSEQTLENPLKIKTLFALRMWGGGVVWSVSVVVGPSSIVHIMLKLLCLGGCCVVSECSCRSIFHSSYSVEAVVFRGCCVVSECSCISIIFHSSYSVEAVVFMGVLCGQ